ncbi:two-component regulator propeller domain-containing protein [Bacteroides sp. 51]|uniref:hybrid sensor histidine kinase/response regulator transcription factor n=1 Tax=Bacteroides sp. 51 TaxID=2302938 RepID=UPI0013D76173|nr:two-component regulator propeller domain-containing protein [Bacteroides sp. 51]NDV83625.1 response regulator [Bacteroides sp. 51]
MYRQHLSFLLFLISTLSFGQNIHFQAIGVENGISQPTVTSIYQDEFGIIWIGTKDGLNRYNGTDFHVFRPIENDKNSLYNNNIGTICGDKNGHIYIRCKYAVVEYDIKKNIFHTIRDNNIQAIGYGNSGLWACTRDSLFTYNRAKDELEYYYHLDNARISCITEDQDGNLYVGTMNNGLYMIDSNKKWLNYLPKKDISCIYEDSKKNIWVGTKDDGLFRLDRNGGQIIDEPYKNKLSSNYIRCVAEDNLGNYWFGTFKGLDMLDVTTNTFTHYSEDNKTYSLSNSSIICMMKDQQGTFWIGTYYGGVNLFNPDYEIYRYYYPDESQKGKLTSPFAGRMKEDSKGGIWIATEGGGVNYLDRKTRTFIEYRQDNKKNSLASNTVQALYLDESNQNLWIGTLKGGLDKLDLNTQTFTNYRHVSGDKNSLINDIIRKIIPYKGNLLLATHNGIGLFDPQTGKCTKALTDSKFNNRQIIDMLIDKNNNLWFSFSLGLVKYNLETQEQNEYFVPNTSKQVTGSNLINVLFEDKKGNIWAGSSGDGIFLYEPDTNTFKAFNQRNSDLINDYILDINESLSGYLLIASNQGFSRFDMENQRFYNYNKQNGFPMTALNSYGLFVASDNEIFLSGPKMMISFFEKELNSYVKPYQLNFTSLEVNNKLILPNDDSGILSESILYQPQITLNHNHSILTIHFSLSNYVSVLKNRIYYKLEGFDKEWINAGYRKGITYTNLNPGKYKLMIKSSEEYSDKGSISKEIDIVVKPPFYKSAWAYCLYAIIAIISAYIIMSFYYSKLKLRASLEYEKKEKKQIEELNQSKLRFFTNISHEFRTPLTLIVSQLEMLMERNDIQPLVYSKLVNVHRNTLRMKRLITELLDFRKQEQGFEKFKYSSQDIYPFLEEIYLSFKEYARGKQINFEFPNKDKNLELWFDVVQLEKVIYNLLSNAFKYTAPGGTVSLSVQEYENSVVILVSDTGVGIAEKSLDKIFDRFYQVDNMDNSKGTGIGLALAKSIIETHKGKVSVQSSEGKGTTFLVELPLGDSHIADSEKVATPDIDSSCISELTMYNDKILADIVEDEKSNNESKEERIRILIVEDNEELRNLLARLFSRVYSVYEAQDGEEGLIKTKEIQPDIVLSDIMMPKMSGIEMCRKIKSNFDTSHIPVILLTAQTAEEYTMQGLKMGADDYVTKPFNVKHLFMRCNNLVNSRKLLQQKYAKQTDNNVDILATNSADHQFMEQCIICIEQNLDNPDFDVNMFAQAMNAGRTKLFLKIKGITGQTPNDFILNIRLKKAQTLLKQTDTKTVSEIAYEVGFNSPSYFIKCFRELFGVTPAQYQKQDK